MPWEIEAKRLSRVRGQHEAHETLSQGKTNKQKNLGSGPAVKSLIDLGSNPSTHIIANKTILRPLTVPGAEAGMDHLLF